MVVVPANRSVVIMHFGKRRTWVVELANALAAADIQTTLLVLGPTTWLRPREVPLDRAVRVEFLVDYLELSRWERWRPRLSKALGRAMKTRRFGPLGGAVRSPARAGIKAVRLVDLAVRPLLLDGAVARLLRENDIPDPDIVVSADSLSRPAADDWGRRHPDRPVLVGRNAATALMDLGVHQES